MHTHAHTNTHTQKPVTTVEFGP